MGNNSHSQPWNTLSQLLPQPKLPLSKWYIKHLFLQASKFCWRDCLISPTLGIWKWDAWYTAQQYLSGSRRIYLSISLHMSDKLKQRVPLNLFQSQMPTPEMWRYFIHIQTNYCTPNSSPLITCDPTWLFLLWAQPPNPYSVTLCLCSFCCSVREMKSPALHYRNFCSMWRTAFALRCF